MAWYDFLTDNAGSIGAMALGGLLGSQNGSSQSGTSTTTSAPWAPQQPYLLDVFNRANTLSKQPANSPMMNSALQGMQGALNPALSGMATNAISKTLATDPSQYYGIGRTNPYAGDNPYLQSTIDAAGADAMRSLKPQFDSMSRASGSFGNSGVSESFGRAAGETLGNIATNARMQNYNQSAGLAENQINRDVSQYNTGQSNINQAAFNAPGFNSANMNNYGQLYNAGAQNQQTQWQPLNNYSALVGGGHGGQNTTPTYSNSAAGLLGGAAMGAGIYSNLFGNTKSS